MDIWIFTYWLLGIILLWAFVYKFSTDFLILLSIYLEMELLAPAHFPFFRKHNLL